VLLEIRDAGGHWPDQRRRIRQRMVEVQDPDRLAKSIDHVVIAVGMEAVAAVVAGDRNRNAAAAHFMHEGHPAPAWGAAACAILKVKIDRGQRHHRHLGLGQEIECPVGLLFGLHREAATVAGDHAAVIAVAQGRAGDMRQRCSARVVGFVDVKVEVEIVLRSETEEPVEQRVEIVEWSAVGTARRAGHRAENATRFRHEGRELITVFISE
jgi:hypothetical protein